MQQMMQGKLEEKDWMHTILSLLKQTTSGYALAVTEARCAMVRQTMQRFFNETVTEQGDCSQIMLRQGWYAQPEEAPRQSIRKAISTHRQTGQMINQFLQAQGVRSMMQKPTMPQYQQAPYGMGTYQQPASYQPPAYQPTSNYQAYTPSDMSAGTAEWVRQQAINTRNIEHGHGEMMH